ncbi:MAG: Dabb family protein [Thermogutta sp.]
MKKKVALIAALLLALVGGLVVQLYAESQAKFSHAGQVRHVVLFKFKDGTSPEDVAKIEKAFAALPSKIPQIAGFEWGTDCSVENLSQGFTHCFILTFKNVQDRDAYLPHPEHKAFGQLLRPHLDKVLVIDYVVRE